MLNLLTFLSFFFSKFSIHIGFYLKPYMILAIFRIKNLNKISNLYEYETILLTFYILYISTSLYSAEPLLSLRMSLGFILFLLTYFIFRNFFKQHFKFEHIFTIGIIFSILSLFYYLIGFIHISELSSENPVSYGLYYDRMMYRMAGFGGNPDYFNIFNIIFIFYAYCNLNRKKNKLLFVLSLINTLLTFSISAIFTIVVVLLIDFFFFNNFKEKISKIVLFFLIFSIFLVSIYTFVDIEYIVKIIEIRCSNLETGSGRFQMWFFALDLIKEHFLFGISINNLRVITQEQFHIINIHNTYLEILVEAGIFVFSFFVLFQILLLFNLHKVYKINSSVKYIILSILAIFINMFFVSSLIHESFLFLLLISYSIISNNLTPIQRRKHETK